MLMNDWALDKLYHKRRGSRRVKAVLHGVVRAIRRGNKRRIREYLRLLRLMQRRPRLAPVDYRAIQLGVRAAREALEPPVPMVKIVKKVTITKPNGEVVEKIEHKVTEKTTPAPASNGKSDIETAVEEVEAAEAEVEGGGIGGFLWPTEKPIYKRPGAWLLVGGLLLAAKKG